MGWFKREPKNLPPDSGAYPDFRWENGDQLTALKAFDPTVGPLVGFFNGRPFYHPAGMSPHALILGKTGVGKTTKVGVPLVLSDFVSKMSLFAVDVSGDFGGMILDYRSKLGPSFLMDPSNMFKGVKLGSTKRVGYNPMKDYLCAGDKLRFASRSAKLTRYITRNDAGHDRFFYTMSQRLMKGVIMATAKHARAHATLPEVMKVFNEDHVLDWVRRFFKQDGADPLIRQILAPFHVPQSKEYELKSILDVVNTIGSETTWILDEAITDFLNRDELRVKRFEEEICTGVLAVPLELLDDDYDRLISMVMGCFLSQFQRFGKRKTPILFWFDEAASYCSEAVAKLITKIYRTGRKYNLRVFIAVTALKDLEDCFKHGLHHSIINNSGLIQVLNVSDADSTEWVKKLSGEKTAYSTSRTRSSQSGYGPNSGGSSTSTTTTPHTVPVIRSYELRGISQNSQIVMMDECKHLIFAETKVFKDIPGIAARAGENPFWDAKPEKVKKPSNRKKKVDEVAILLKAYGRK